MRPTTVSDEDLLDRLGEVLSRRGVEGSSMAILAEASGLKRASLYHRFPGGKDEIVASAARRAGELMAIALACAYDDAAPSIRAERVANAIREYYDDGARSCLIIALSVADDEGRSAGLACVDQWTKAFCTIASDAGMSAAAAEDAALDAIASIEGALVLAATSGNTRPFHRALDALPQRLTNVAN